VDYEWLNVVEIAINANYCCKYRNYKHAILIYRSVSQHCFA